jgi:DNA recombination protein RmuC
MANIIYIILGATVSIILIGFTVWLIFARKLQKNTNGEIHNEQSMLLIQNQINNLSKVIDSKLGESRKDMQEAVQTQFSESKKLINEINEQVTKHLLDVTKGITETKEASKQIFSVAEGLQNLEKVLKNQKQRGNLGEASLELSLSNILPPDAYEMQYLFNDGDQVDAIIKTKEGFIPIDAKFSLDNYNRIVNETDEDKKMQFEKDFRNDLKKRIDETAKYIRTKDGTLPFAFMFIPAEGIYYDLLINKIGEKDANTRSIIDYAYTDKNVIIVSPTTFTAYLQSVLYGFKAFKIEESAKMIRKRVEELGRHMKKYEDYYTKLGNALKTTVNHFNAGYKELGKVDKDVMRITESSPGITPIAIDKPDTEDRL